MQSPSLKMLNTGPIPFVQLGLARGSQWLLLRYLALTVFYESLKFTEVSGTHHTPTEYFATMFFLGKHFLLFGSETSLLTPNPVYFPTLFSRLSSEWFWAMTKTEIHIQSLKRLKGYGKEWCHMLQTIPQVNFQKSFWGRQYSFICMSPRTFTKQYQYSPNGEEAKHFCPENNKHQYGYQSTTGKLWLFICSLIHSCN